MEGREVMRQHLCQHWVHSEEEDSEALMIYRLATFDFPPVKSRAGFRTSLDFDLDGNCTIQPFTLFQWQSSKKGRAIVSIGLMPGVAAHKVNSAAGGREGPLGEAVRAKA